MVGVLFEVQALIRMSVEAQASVYKSFEVRISYSSLAILSSM